MSTRRSLTTRVVATVVALLVLATVVVSVAATWALSTHLRTQLDDQLRSASQRLQVRQDLPGDGPGPAAPPPGASPCNRLAPRGPSDLAGQGAGTLVGFSDTMCSVATVIGQDGTGRRLDARDRTRLMGLAPDGEPHDVTLAAYGSYRVLARVDGQRLTYVGLPTGEMTAAVDRLVLVEVLVGLAVLLAGGTGGYALVRAQLRPLRDLAGTAREVSRTPMSRAGEQIGIRVRDDLTDTSTEVGQVGDALDQLLHHVDEALGERDRTEHQLRRFVADASHELRTPLATIQGYAQLAARERDAETALTAVDKVRTESTRMAVLVEDLLLLARLDAGRPLDREPVDLTLLTLEAVEDARVVDDDHVWVLQLPEEPVEVVGDEQRLHQVLDNLLSNARRHTPAGTTVTTSLTADGGLVRLTVADDGPGLPDDLRATVFDRFTRGDESRTRVSGGAGLGLSIARSIVEAHGGTVTLGPGPGAAFVITLPPPDHAQVPHSQA